MSEMDGGFGSRDGEGEKKKQVVRKVLKMQFFKFRYEITYLMERKSFSHSHQSMFLLFRLPSSYNEPSLRSF